jgi:PAS domain S-box-containing protein
MMLDSQGVVYSGMRGKTELDLDFTVSPEKVTEIFAAIQNSTKYQTMPDGIERFRGRSFIRNQQMCILVEAGYHDWMRLSEARTKNILLIQILLSVLILAGAGWFLKTVEYNETMRIQLNSFFSSALDLMCIADTNGTFVRVNQAWQNTLGYSIEELENHSFLDFVHHADLQYTINAVRRLREQEAVLNFTNRYQCKDGSFRWIEWRSLPKGDLIYAAARDITSRMQADAALKESEERFKLLHTASFGGIAIHDSGIILECNLGLTIMTGYTREELIGMNGLMLCAESCRNMIAEKIRTAYEKPYDAVGLKKTGEEYFLRIESRQLPYRGKTVRVTEFRDITQQKRIEEELKQSELRFQTFMNFSPFYGYIKDKTLKHIYRNEPLQSLLPESLAPGHGDSAGDIFAPEITRMLEEADKKIINGVESNLEVEFNAEIKGRLRWIKDIKFHLELPDGQPAVGGLAFDITDQKHAEEERIKLQKLEGIGTLAGGIAHDFNNLLMALFGNITMARLKIDEDHPATASLVEAENAMERATSLTRQLLTFARGGEPIRQS